MGAVGFLLLVARVPCAGPLSSLTFVAVVDARARRGADDDVEDSIGSSPGSDLRFVVADCTSRGDGEELAEGDAPCLLDDVEAGES